jgi:ATP adenylyltransferase
MVMPYAHLDRLADLPTEAAHELIDLAQRTEQGLSGSTARKASTSG